MEKIAEKQKYIFIEVLRIVACFLVIVNHTTALYFNPNAYMYTTPPKSWFISLIYLYICKMAIPLFVMISGYTMLDKEDDYKKSAQRIFRIILILLIFSSIYYVNNWMKGMRATIGIVDYIKALYYSPQVFAYWYMYMYLGLLVMMPFLQKLAGNMKKLDCQVMIGISLVTHGFLPIVEYNWPEWTSSKIVDLSLFTGFINMMMIGHYIKKYVEPSKKLFKFSIVGFVAIIAFNVVITCFEFQKNNGMNYLFYENRSFFTIILQAAFFFYIVKCIQWKGNLANVLKVIGGCTFGIYLFVDLIIEKTMSVYYYLCAIGIHPIISEVLWQILIFMIGLVVAYIMKKIPLLKKLL